MCRDIKSKAGWIWLISNLQSFSEYRTGCDPSQTCREEQRKRGEIGMADNGDADETWPLGFGSQVASSSYTKGVWTATKSGA